MVLGLTLKSLIHFEFILVCGVRRSSFNILTTLLELSVVMEMFYICALHYGGY